MSKLLLRSRRNSTVRAVSIWLLLVIGCHISRAQQPEPDKPVAMSKPKLPFVQKDICPFECCKYQDWTAEQNVALYSTWKRSGRKAIGTIAKGEKVRASTGVVVTYQPGRFKAREKDSGLGVEKGDEVSVYSYRGEGYNNFWSNGKFYEDQIMPDATCEGKRNERMFT